MTEAGVMTGGMSVKLNRALMPFDGTFLARWCRNGADLVQKKCARGRVEKGYDTVTSRILPRVLPMYKGYAKGYAGGYVQAECKTQK
jgi:hypothetical protein